MYRASIIAALLASAAVAFGQSTSGWQTVVTDDSGLYTNGVLLGGETGIYKPAYACVASDTDPLHTAASVTVTDGTIESGTVTNTRTIDQTYLLVGESGQWKIDFTFTNVAGQPTQIDWLGYYDGNPAHVIDLDMWNFTSSQWDTVQADAFTDSGTDEYTVQAVVPDPQTNYISSGVCTVRIDHTSTAIAGHDFATDYMAILESQVSIPTAGVYVAVGGFANCVDPANMGVDTTSGVITSLVDGVFMAQIDGTGTGSTNTIFSTYIFTNGVRTEIGFSRKIGDSGDIGNAGARRMISVTNGTEFSIGITADTDNATATFLNFSANFNKLDN
jgi:hypothetical protein